MSDLQEVRRSGEEELLASLSPVRRCKRRPDIASESEGRQPKTRRIGRFRRISVVNRVAAAATMVVMTQPRTEIRAGSVSNPQAYRDNLFRLLGDRDPLDVLAETAPLLADIVRKHPATALHARPGIGQWTANEVIGHLVDGEWVYGYRARLILCEEDPAILGTNQDQWVTRQRHNDREPSELVETFAVLRECNLAWWKRMSPADLSRTGRHNERGVESLDVMWRMLAGHDLSHLNQITRSVRAGSTTRTPTQG